MGYNSNKAKQTDSVHGVRLVVSPRLNFTTRQTPDTLRLFAALYPNKGTMNRAETIVAEQIEVAFEGVMSSSGECEYSSWQEIPESWFSDNEDVFSYYSHPDEKFLLPACMCYLLKTNRINPGTLTYINIANTLAEYSKEKSDSCFKNTITKTQFQAVEAFIKHFTFNQAVNIDREQWEKTLRNWPRHDEKI